MLIKPERPGRSTIISINVEKIFSWSSTCKYAFRNLHKHCEVQRKRSQQGIKGQHHSSRDNPANARDQTGVLCNIKQKDCIVQTACTELDPTCYLRKSCKFRAQAGFRYTRRKPVQKIVCCNLYVKKNAF